MMVTIDIAGSGSSWTGSVNGRVKASGSSATAVLVAMAKTYPRNATIYAPAAMSHCMKAGDIVSRGDTASATAPAYNSSNR